MKSDQFFEDATTGFEFFINMLLGLILLPFLPFMLLFWSVGWLCRRLSK